MSDSHQPDVFYLHHWVIDWDKIKTVEHVIELLKCCDIQPRPSHPQFDEIKHMCKMIDADGRQVDPTTLKPL